MPQGPGKYDEACNVARIATGGRTVVLIVIDGRKGSGFAVQALVPGLPASELARILRNVADEIARSAD